MIPANELLIESYDPLPPGGQRVGTLSGVKVTHIPTGIVVIVDWERSQHRNMAIARDAIAGALTSTHCRNCLPTQ